MDDLKGRRTAEFYRVETITTIGIMFELFVNRILPKADYVRNVKNYAARGWISGDILDEFIRRGDNLS